MAPPPTYFLLVAATVLLAPWIWRAAKTRDARRSVAGILLAMLVLETGLIVLYWSLPACAALATAAAILAVAPIRHPGRSLIAVCVGVAAAILGTAFVLARQEDTFLVYFASGLPFLFTAVFAFNVAALGRWRLDRRVLLPSVGLLGFAALFPVSSFMWFFLEWFEAAHLPITLVALASLHRLARLGSEELDAARRTATGAESIAEFLERPSVESRAALPLLVGGALAAFLITWWQYIAGGIGLAGWGSLALLVAGLASLSAFRFKGRWAGSVQWASGLFLLLGALLVLTDVAEHRVETFSEVGTAMRLGAGTLAAWCIGVGLLFLFARAGDEATRRRWADHAVGVAKAADLSRLVAASGGTWTSTAGRFDARDLDAIVAELVGSKAAFAVVPVRPVSAEWTLPDELLAKLEGSRVHVAVLEGDDAFVSPPLVLDPEAL